MKRTIVIQLEIEGDADTASEVVEGALDAGVIQDLLLGYDHDGEPFTIVQASSRLEVDPEAAVDAPFVSQSAPCPLRQGWGLFDTGVGDMEVERDDEEDLFEDDAAARAHIRGCQGCLTSLTFIADGLPVEPLLAPKDDEGSAAR